MKRIVILEASRTPEVEAPIRMQDLAVTRKSRMIRTRRRRCPGMKCARQGFASNAVEKDTFREIVRKRKRRKPRPKRAPRIQFNHGQTSEEILRSATRWKELQQCSVWFCQRETSCSNYPGNWFWF